MQTVILATMMHSGTDFFRGILERHYPYIGFEAALAGQPGLAAIHISDRVLDALEYRCKGNPVLVTTLRHWRDMELSWKRAGRDMPTLPIMRECWMRFLEMDPFILSVDCQRQERLDRLSAHLGVKLETDWQAPDNVIRSKV